MNEIKLTTTQTVMIIIGLLIIFSFVSGINVKVRYWNWERFVPIIDRDKDKDGKDDDRIWKPFRPFREGDMQYYG
jgi:hypothetical protein